jgi:hypothetical protein
MYLCLYVGVHLWRVLPHKCSKMWSEWFCLLTFLLCSCCFCLSTLYKEKALHCCENLKLSYRRTLRQVSRKQCFIVLAQSQQTYVQSLSSKNKGVSPCVPLQGYRSKEQGLIHIWLYLILLATLS